jgi:hypothetical protein
MAHVRSCRPRSAVRAIVSAFALHIPGGVYPYWVAGA